MSAFARLSCGLALAASALAPVLEAQTPGAPRDTAVRARPTRDSTVAHPADAPFLLALLVVPAGVLAMGMLYFAPAPLAPLMRSRDTTQGSVLPNQVTISTAVGGTFHAGQTWTNAVNLEGVRGHVRGELSVEDFWRPQHLQYVSVRGAYLWRPSGQVAGGVSLGYMHADVDDAQRGAELGLPLYYANARGEDVRFEPTYVIGRRLLFNYRVQLRIPVARSRYFLGGSIVAKGDPPPSSPAYPGDFTGTGYMLLLGAHL
jgi:hypothetical protein